MRGKESIAKTKKVVVGLGIIVIGMFAQDYEMGVAFWLFLVGIFVVVS